jgi:hypothetical protein
MRPRAGGKARGPEDAVGPPMRHGRGGRLSALPRRLDSYLAQWPLWPPACWRWRTLWVGWGLLVWTAETVIPTAVHMVPFWRRPICSM